MNIVKENENTHKDNIDVFNPILKTDNKLFVMPNTTSRYFELFLSKFTKDCEPNSIQKWLDKFPNLNIRTICRVLNLSFLQSDIREVTYELFHNVIFTKEKLLKCKITNDDLCPICSIQSENVYHMLLECSSLHSFNEYIKCFLHDVLAKSSPDFVNQLDFEMLCMFGLLQNSKSVNFYFGKNILAIRKFCIIKRRNIAIREGKSLNIEDYFRSTVLKNVQYAYEYYKSTNSLNLFEKYYEQNNPVLSVLNNIVR